MILASRKTYTLCVYILFCQFAELRYLFWMRSQTLQINPIKNKYVTDKWDNDSKYQQYFYLDEIVLKLTSSISSMLVMACRNSWERGMMFCESSWESSIRVESIDSTCSKSPTWPMLASDIKVWKLEDSFWLWFSVLLLQVSSLAVNWRGKLHLSWTERLHWQNEI